jgi:hypothetical protein
LGKLAKISLCCLILQKNGRLVPPPKGVVLILCMCSKSQYCHLPWRRMIRIVLIFIGIFYL